MAIEGHRYSGIHAFFKRAVLRFYDFDGSHHQGLKSNDNVTSSIDYVLPQAGPTVDGQVLAATVAGQMSWASVATSVTLVPVGAIVAWGRDIGGVPALSANWLECNGQVVSDAGSPMNGFRLPNLNNFTADVDHLAGVNRFLRGSRYPGSVGGSEEHFHNLTLSSVCEGTSGSQSIMRQNQTQIQNHLPYYYDVIWLIRIK